MTPLDFAKLFDAVSADLMDSMTAVAGTRLGSYTDWFSEKFIPKISRQSNLHLHREGRPAKIDYVLSQDDQVPYRLNVAIEHEKNGASSTEEIAKFANLMLDFLSL